jgi:hypothetical protein
MFRTGGPIGEGVMHGMNGLQNGGTVRHMNGLANGGMPDKRGLVDGPGNYAGLKTINQYLNPFAPGKKWWHRGLDAAGYGIPIAKYLASLPMKNGGVASLNNRAALVGNPVYPQTGGREHHWKALKDIPKYAKPGYWTKGWTNPGTVGGKVKSWFTPKAMPSTVRHGLGPSRTPTKWEGVKNWYKTTPVGKYIGSTPEAGALTYALSAGKGIVPKVAKAVSKSPTATLGGAYMLDAFPGGEPLLNLDVLGNRNILGQRYDPKTNKRIKGTGISSFWEDEEVKIPPPETKKIITGNTKKSQAERDAEKKIKDEDQLNKIYSLLGVDRAKKNAASKALIDMSRYIDEGGKDVISKKNIGSTISKAISAFDKRLDKVDQLKEAAGLMRAKGIIEKDIRSADNELKELTKQKYYKELHPKFSELKITAAKTMPGQKGYNSAAAAASDNYRGNIITQSDFSDIIEDIKEKSGELDETIIITNWTNEKIKEKNLADGDYTVGDALVTIIEGKVDSVAR